MREEREDFRYSDCFIRITHRAVYSLFLFPLE